jgi:hypothetical protein
MGANSEPWGQGTADTSKSAPCWDGADNFRCLRTASLNCNINETETSSGHEANTNALRELNLFDRKNRRLKKTEEQHLNYLTRSRMSRVLLILIAHIKVQNACMSKQSPDVREELFATFKVLHVLLGGVVRLCGKDGCLGPEILQHLPAIPIRHPLQLLTELDALHFYVYFLMLDDLDIIYVLYDVN